MAPRTFSRAFSDVAARSPDRCAFRLAPGLNLTFARLYCLVEAAAAWLFYSGIRHGDVVFLVFPNTVEFVVLLLAVMRCRAEPVPVHRSCRRYRFESCLRKYRPKLLLVGQDGDPTKEDAAKAHGVSLAVASVHYNASDSVHTSPFVLLKLVSGHLKPLVPATFSMLVNEPQDVALFLPQAVAGPSVPVTQEEFVASIGNSNLAQNRLLPLFQAYNLLGDLVHSLSATLQALDAEDKIAIESGLKLNELALTMSLSSMVPLIIFFVNQNKRLIHRNMWRSTALLLFFGSFALSLAGVQYHRNWGRSSVYVGKVALFAFFSGVATTVISVLPEESLVAPVVITSVYGLLTILIICGWAWQLHPRDRIREAAAEMAAAAAAFTSASSSAIAAAPVASPIQAPPNPSICTWLTGWGSRKWTLSVETEASVRQVQGTRVPV